MFNKILIANRGEIACRIIKTTRSMGIQSVAVYSTADKDSLHVKMADEAYCIGEAKSTESYLNISAILAVAKMTRAQAIHPGYGFLSENAQFAAACEKEQITFIGPGIHALEAMGSKQAAKQILETTDVPLTPGYHGDNQTDAFLLDQAQKIGFPVLLKAAAGGGGKGMRTVAEEGEFYPSLTGARREAKASFGDDTMIIEKLIQQPRHVEMQIFADQQGNVVHLYERDCSIQRRHQKIIEEAPAPNLSLSVRQGLAKAAIQVARTIDYRGAGTVEFLVSPNDDFYFMEMNTRLQVEHPVTEMITGLDLVEWQLRIAAGEPLPLQQKDIEQNGHAIECRIYAEDPQNDFLPSIGHLSFLKEPKGEGIRIDTGVTQHSEISMYYDPMIAKLVAWGTDRTEALRRLQQALEHYVIGGVKTNLYFLKSILHHPKFTQAQLSTDFLNQEPIVVNEENSHTLIFAAACYDYLTLVSPEKNSLPQDTFAWQLHLPTQWRQYYLLQKKLYAVTLHPINHFEVEIQIEEERQHFRIHLHDFLLRLDNGKEQFHLWIEPHSRQLIFYSSAGVYTVERFDWLNAGEKNSEPESQLTAPMPATVVAILKKKGDKIKAGERLMVLEAMKMEHTIHAPKDGILSEIFYEIGSQVKEGAELLCLETETE